MQLSTLPVLEGAGSWEPAPVDSVDSRCLFGHPQGLTLAKSEKRRVAEAPGVWTGIAVAALGFASSSGCCVRAAELSSRALSPLPPRPPSPRTICASRSGTFLPITAFPRGHVQGCISHMAHGKALRAEKSSE